MKNYCLQWCRRHESTVCDKHLMNYGRGWGSHVGAGQAMTKESVYVYFFPRQFGLVTWIRLEVMLLFVTGHSHCHASFCQLGHIVNQLSFGSWPTFPLTALQVFWSIWNLYTFLLLPLQQPLPLLASWHEYKRTQTHLTSNQWLHSSADFFITILHLKLQVKETIWSSKSLMCKIVVNCEFSSDRWGEFLSCWCFLCWFY